MKYFPFLLHFILACIAIGVAAGMNTTGYNHVIAYGMDGAAIALGVSCFMRILMAI